MEVKGETGVVLLNDHPGGLLNGLCPYTSLSNKYIQDINDLLNVQNITIKTCLLSSSMIFFLRIHWIRVLPMKPHFPLYINLFNNIFPQFPFPFSPINPNSLENKGSCWILKDCYCSVTMLRELGLKNIFCFYVISRWSPNPWLRKILPENGHISHFLLRWLTFMHTYRQLSNMYKVCAHPHFHMWSSVGIRTHAVRIFFSPGQMGPISMKFPFF